MDYKDVVVIGMTLLFGSIGGSSAGRLAGLPGFWWVRGLALSGRMKRMRGRRSEETCNEVRKPMRSGWKVAAAQW